MNMCMYLEQAHVNMHAKVRSPFIGIISPLCPIDGNLPQQRHCLIIPIQDQRVV